MSSANLDSQKIGYGSYGQIYYNGQYCIKKFTENSSPAIIEIVALSFFKNHNIIQYHGVELLNGILTMSIENKDTDLEDYIFKNPFVAQPEIKRMVKSLAEGLHYLHSRGYAHRDLTPRNVVLNVNCPTELKIIDFGFGSGRFYSTHSDIVVASWYRAPEVFLMLERTYDFQIDIWSLGCIWAFMIMKDHLFGGAKDHDVFVSIKETLKGPKIKALPEDCQLFLERYPEDRPTIADFLKRPYDVSDVLSTYKGHEPKESPKAKYIDWAIKNIYNLSKNLKFSDATFFNAVEIYRRSEGQSWESCLYLSQTIWEVYPISEKQYRRITGKRSSLLREIKELLDLGSAMPIDISIHGFINLMVEKDKKRVIEEIKEHLYNNTNDTWTTNSDFVQKYITQMKKN